MSETVFVVLFRGINVGGNKVAKMETLRLVLTKAGFGSVATYIQSGNVVLSSAMKASEVAAAIEKLFAETFGFTSRPTVRSAEAWRAMIARNPFPEGTGDHKKLHAVLLDGAPDPDAAERLQEKATAAERFAITEGVLYLYTPDGFGRSKLAESLDRILRVPLTARNWRTVQTLMDMADKAAGTARDSS
ncbi:MAG TPA: DUF1697 domain-containing protein [Rhizobiaceae bacterium]|nr:DUF1697 domain-containing protein [Rhizobiaceae bacterium]